MDQDQRDLIRVKTDVGEPDHVDPERDHCCDQHGHQPMQYDRRAAILPFRICQLHDSGVSAFGKKGISRRGRKDSTAIPLAEVVRRNETGAIPLSAGVWILQKTRYQLSIPAAVMSTTRLTAFRRCHRRERAE